MILDTAMNDTRAKVLICIFLIVATFCIYSQVQDHKFINFDDDLYITKNLNVQAGLTSESVGWAFTNFAVVQFCKRRPTPDASYERFLRLRVRTTDLIFSTAKPR